MASPPTTQPDYISGNAALRILKTGWYTLQHAAVTGAVRTDIRLGRSIRYHKGDIEKLARERSRQLHTQTAGA
jgi:hypothetical protein